MAVKPSPRWYAGLSVLWLLLAVGQTALAMAHGSTFAWVLAAGLAVLALLSLTRWAAARRGTHSTS